MVLCGKYYVLVQIIFLYVLVVVVSCLRISVEKGVVWRLSYALYYGRRTGCITAVIHIVRRPPYNDRMALMVEGKQ